MTDDKQMLERVLASLNELIMQGCKNAWQADPKLMGMMTRARAASHELQTALANPEPCAGDQARWKLMPEEATDEMIDAAIHVSPDMAARFHREKYRAMWKAAPESPLPASSACALPPGRSQSQQVLKDHEIAQLVNQLRDIAIEFHGAQQLRERIAGALVPALQGKRT